MDNLWIVAGRSSAVTEEISSTSSIEALYEIPRLVRYGTLREITLVVGCKAKPDNTANEGCSKDMTMLNGTML